jgi:SH3 domain protein
MISFHYLFPEPKQRPSSRLQHLFLLLLAGALLCLPATVQSDQTVYVSDQLKTIPVRAGQGMEYKIITFLAPGDAVSLLPTGGDESDWVRIRFARDKEGYVLRRYLTTQVPASLQLAEARQRAAELEKKVASLSTTNHEYRRGNTELLNEVKKLTGQLNQLRHDYETLRNESSEYLELKAAHEQLSTRFTELQGAHRILREEHETLRKAYAIKWFLAGTAAVLLGILIGVTLQSLRGRKKRSESLRFK